MNIFISIFILLIAFEVKHFFCDWVFQTQYMVEGKGKLQGWILPLFCHAGLHGFWSGAIMTAYWHSVKIGLICACFDTAAHFTIDRIKSSPNFFGVYKNQDKWYWIILGADQFAHHTTYLLIVFAAYQLF